MSIKVKYFVTVSVGNHCADITLKFDSRSEADAFVDTFKNSVTESFVYGNDTSNDDKVDILVEEAEFSADGHCMTYPYRMESCDVEKNYNELQKEIDEVETNDDQVDDTEDDCMNKYEATKLDVQRYLEDTYNEEELKENVLYNRERFEAEVFAALLIEGEDVLSGAVADVLDDLDMKYFYNYDAE